MKPSPTFELFTILAMLILVLLIVSSAAHGQSILIDAAGPGDQYFTPNGTCAVGGTCRATNVAMGPPPMATQRYGVIGTPFTYAVPVAPGAYDVVLSFAERVKTKPGQRVFTVTVQGEQSAPIDLVKITGGPNFPYIQTWSTVHARGGLITIDFKPVLSATGQPIGDPVVNAIEIRPAAAFALNGPIDGMNRVYTVAAGSGLLAVYWNGLFMTPGIDYTVSGNAITFIRPPTGCPEVCDILTGIWQ